MLKHKDSVLLMKAVAVIVFSIATTAFVVYTLSQPNL
jgi:hypothetical protein